MIDFDDEPLTVSLDGCCICASIPVARDAFGFSWCENHLYRVEFLEWGERHDWPALRYADGDVGYAITDDAETWLAMAAIGSEDCILSLILAFDEYERVQQGKVA